MTDEKDELRDLTMHLLDLKTEKKQYNKDMNENIKAAEKAILDYVTKGPRLL